MDEKPLTVSDLQEFLSMHATAFGNAPVRLAFSDSSHGPQDAPLYSVTIVLTGSGAVVELG
jgi:hypothetical protein